MALTKEDLQAISTLLEVERKHTSKMMDEKLSESLEPINNILDKINVRLDALEESQQVIRASQLKVELEQLPRIGAALDGYQANREKSEQQGERITFLETKTDNHDIRLYSLEQAVKKA